MVPEIIQNRTLKLKKRKKNFKGDRGVKKFTGHGSSKISYARQQCQPRSQLEDLIKHGSP